MLNVFDGQITQTDGLRDALEGILSAKSVQNGVLRIQSDLVSGRVGIFCARFITGAQVDATGESGGLALRRLLAARNGSFSFEDARGSDISDLKQSLSIDVEILLENMTELLAGKSVSLSDGSMFGFALPAQRIRKPTGEDAANAPAPAMVAPTASATAAAAPTAPSAALSQQWKELTSQRAAAAAAGAPESNGEAGTGDYTSSVAEAAARISAEAPGPAMPVAVPPQPAEMADPTSPSLADELLPTDNTFEFGALGTSEQQALEITGEFGTFGSPEPLTAADQDIRSQIQISAPKPSVPQVKPSIPIPPAEPPKLTPPMPPTIPAANRPEPSPAPVGPQPITPLPQPAPAPQSAFGGAENPFIKAANNFASAAAAPAQPSLAAQAFGDMSPDFSDSGSAFNAQLQSPTGGPQPGLIKPAKNELEDFVSELQAYSNNKEAESQQMSTPQIPRADGSNELEDFVAEMQGTAAKAPMLKPGGPDINPFNDEVIPPESGSFGIGDLFASSPKKTPEPPKPAPKMSGSEFTMNDLFSGKPGANQAGIAPGGAAPSHAAASAPGPAAPPIVPSQPSQSSPSASAFGADAHGSTSPSAKNSFSDAFSEKSPGMADESLRPSVFGSDAQRPPTEPFASEGGALGNESIRPSAFDRGGADSEAAQPGLGNESIRPTAFPQDSKAANTLPPVRSATASNLSGAAAGLPSEQKSGPLAGLPSQKGTTDYQLPSQQGKPSTQSPRSTGQTMKSALTQLPSMQGRPEEAQASAAKPRPEPPPQDDWPEDFPPPERMRRNTDAVQKPSAEQKSKAVESIPAWDDPAFDPEELMKKRRERKGVEDPSDDPFARIAASRASEAANSNSKLRAIVEEGVGNSAFAPMAHPNQYVKPPSHGGGPKPGFKKLNQWNSTGMFAVKIFGVLLVLGAGAGFWHFYGAVVMAGVQKMFAPPPPPAPPKPPVVTKPKTQPTATKKKTKRRRRRPAK